MIYSLHYFYLPQDSPLSKLPKKSLDQLSLMKSRSRENIARLEPDTVSAEVECDTCSTVLYCSVLCRWVTIWRGPPPWSAPRSSRRRRRTWIGPRWSTPLPRSVVLSFIDFSD